jgi:hypothetical protein
MTMPAPTKTFDTRCYDLAELFLSDVEHINTDARCCALADLIQQTIEDYIRYEADNYDPPTGAIQDEPDFPGFADNH